MPDFYRTKREVMRDYQKELDKYKNLVKKIKKEIKKHRTLVETTKDESYQLAHSMIADWLEEILEEQEAKK